MTRPQQRVLRWADPPATNWDRLGRRSTGSKWDIVAEQLMDQHGRWAVIFAGTRGEAAGVRSLVREARVACFRPVGDFEVTMRTVAGPTVVEVYARYVGPPP